LLPLLDVSDLMTEQM